MKFFLTVTPGFETLARTELLDWLPHLLPETVAVEHGGVSFEAELSEGLELNRQLRIPTRILARVADFGCRDFPKLFKKFSGLAWSDWVPDLAQVDFQVSSHGSRVKMKKRIEETCLAGRIQYLKKKGLPHSKVVTGPDADFVFYVRFFDDVCFVSFDTSGEKLYKRGLREKSSAAPLRETFASGLLQLMEQTVKRADTRVGGNGPSELTPGIPRPVQLVDPMMGGGTFLIEAAGRGVPVASREFSYLHNPALLARMSAATAEASTASEVSVNLDELAELDAKKRVEIEGEEKSKLGTDSSTVEKTAEISPGPILAPGHDVRPLNRYRSLIGFEMNAHVAQSARANLEHLLAESRPAAASVQVETLCQDFFQAQPLAKPEAGVERWVICNPPYGERIRIEGRPSEFYEKLFAQMETALHPYLVGVIIPQKIPAKSLKVPREWRFANSLRFSNGGLPVEALIYRRRDH